VGAKYEYEKYTFQYPYFDDPSVIGKVRYTPDFYLPDHHIWIEIKGVEADPVEMAKGQRLARETGETVFFYVGFPKVTGRTPSYIQEIGPNGIVDDLSWGDFFEGISSGSAMILEWFPFVKSESDFWQGVEAGRIAFRAPPPKRKDFWIR
jgi:hypothetical protein